jgi:hypothetical protein
MHILLLFAMLHYWPVGPQPVGIHHTTRVHAIGPVSAGLHRF